MTSRQQVLRLEAMNSKPAIAYCTMFDLGYLGRGLTLIESLRAVGEMGDIWTLCLDDASLAYLEDLGLEGVRPISVSMLEETTRGLEQARDGRSRAEFYFTCTPALVCHVLDRPEKYAWVVYLDADMYFFHSPARAFDEMGEGEIGIVPHRFPEQLSSLEQYGTYNVAWVMLRNQSEGRQCATWWRDKCIEWCFDRPDHGRYADQGYLDSFADRFTSTVVLTDRGLNVAPWNLGRHRVVLDRGVMRVDGEDELVFFHFHGLRRRGDWIYPNLATYKTHLSSDVRDHVYRPYIAALAAAEMGTLAINLGRPLPTAGAIASRNTRSIRSAAHRIRRRVIQLTERLTGNAFQIDKIVDDAAAGRRYS